MNTGNLSNLFVLITILLVLSRASFSSSFFLPENEQDKMALVDLKHQFVVDVGTLDENGSALASWNDSLHFCQWEGITCGRRHQRVTILRLEEQKLDGILSPSIGNLTFLRNLSLANNNLHGKIPKEIGYLRRLEFLNLYINSFQGRIPIELANCSNLQTLWLAANKLTGEIPFRMGTLMKLTSFTVHQNNLVGRIPRFLRNLSSLTRLGLYQNSFSGEIQDSFQGLSKMTHLLLYGNNFSGTILPLYNLSSLQALDLTGNMFTGDLSRDIDVAFPQATFLGFSINNFSGTIPASVSNISSLESFQISLNSFSGPVPENLGKLANIRSLRLGANFLGRTKSGDLSFIDSIANCTKLNAIQLSLNRLGGRIPESIANLTTQLQILLMGNNYITGTIPRGIGKLTGLFTLSLGNNFLTGTIPTSLGKLTMLSELNLGGNKLQGGIPSSIGNMTNLTTLFLQENSMDGNIPQSIRNCQGMQKLNISSNNFSGDLPDDFFSQFQVLINCGISDNSFSGNFPTVFPKFEALNSLDGSYNKFSGEIPWRLGESLGLVILKLRGNNFGGRIPESLGNLRGLTWLDLSDNNLSGTIPKQIFDMAFFQNLNLSFNLLEGEVPIFKNVTAVALVGNKNLCGGNRELKLPPCMNVTTKRKKGVSKNVVIAITISVLTSFVLLVFLFIFSRRRRYRKTNVESLSGGYQQVTYAELFKATHGFVESNLIGSGSFGDVYKGDLGQEQPVAVKVLNLSKHGATKSFIAECNVLQNIRHRNLLKIVTSCSSLDYQGNDFKALVYDLKSNGNLDGWLHAGNGQQETSVLSFEKRVDIAVDVGCALDYLHNGSKTPVVHCDLKPSNVLLDDDMVAHVGDFGLAKMILNGGESMSTTMKGSIGYIAPEYGMGAAISCQGDIYSYGILLLELISGKRPTDEIFSDEMSLVSFCEKGTMPDHVEVVVDLCLMHELREAILRQRNAEQTKLQCQALLVNFFEVGVSCAAQSQHDRMDIEAALKCLKGIKEKCSSIFVI